MSKFISRVVPITVAVAGLIAACNQPESRIPTGPSAPFPGGITITGPASIAPGQSAQLSTSVALSGGAGKSTNPADVRWRTSNASVLNVSSTGLATAGNGMGEALITAELPISGTSSRSATREIVVVPDGTYRVVGTVTENTAPFPPIPGAHVEIVPSGPSTLSDFAGQYRLYGVPGSAEIQASASNYSTDKRTLSLSGNSTQNLQLALTGPRSALVGNYTLFLDTDACTGAGSPTLPPDLLHRSYVATLSQNGLGLDIALIEPRFVTNSSGAGNHFSGVLTGGGARFTLDYYFFGQYYSVYYSLFPSVAERLPNDTVLVPAGTANLTGGVTGLSGTLNGSISLWDNKFPSASSRYLGGCASMQMRLVPR